MFNIDQFILWLKDRESVSVPALQRYFDIPYGEARTLLQQMLRRNWIRHPGSGVEYPVCHENVGFRCMTEEEVLAAAKQITNDCSGALRCLLKSGYADFGALERAVRGEDDTRDAIETLTELHMISEGSDEYYLTVDRDSVNRVLAATRKVKRPSPFDD